MQGVTECEGQQLSSLPSSSTPPIASTTEASRHLLHHLTSLRTHLFFMRLDYQLAPGLSGTGSPSSPSPLSLSLSLGHQKRLYVCSFHRLYCFLPSLASPCHG